MPDPGNIANVIGGLGDTLPFDGNVTGSFACNDYILGVSEGLTQYGVTPWGAADGSYILNWMFRYAPNVPPQDVIPGGEFLDAAGITTDEGKVATFRTTETAYKLFNRFQVKMRITTNPASGLPIFNGPPSSVRLPSTDIGITKNPCGLVLGQFLEHFPGQAGPLNGPSTVVYPDTISNVNDGSPDSAAIKAFNVLKGKDLPEGEGTLFWENIGSRITFAAQGGPAAAIVVQPYPTYAIYINGRFTESRSQADMPDTEFVVNPYPFGTVPCAGRFGITPGGRCGDASSAPDVSARRPPFTQQ